MVVAGKKEGNSCHLGGRPTRGAALFSIRIFEENPYYTYVYLKVPGIISISSILSPTAERLRKRAETSDELDASRISTALPFLHRSILS